MFRKVFTHYTELLVSATIGLTPLCCHVLVSTVTFSPSPNISRLVYKWVHKSGQNKKPTVELPVLHWLIDNAIFTLWFNICFHGWALHTSCTSIIQHVTIMYKWHMYVWKN